MTPAEILSPAALAIVAICDAWDAPAEHMGEASVIIMRWDIPDGPRVRATAEVSVARTVFTLTSDWTSCHHIFQTANLMEIRAFAEECAIDTIWTMNGDAYD